MAVLGNVVNALSTDTTPERREGRNINDSLRRSALRVLVMTAHTPGPWEIVATPRLVDIRATGDSEGTTMICSLTLGARAWYKGQVIPNANLIAAAPELLATAEGLLNALSVEMVTGNGLVPRFNALRLAINHARGLYLNEVQP
jgi:hypothetical protein